MAKSSEEESLVRKHILIAEDDWEWLTHTYGENVGVSKAIRTMVRTYRKQIEEKINAQTQAKAAETSLNLPL